MSNFLKRAYRRPPTDKQIDALHGVYLSRKSKGIDSWQAFKDSLKAALCSPHFIYLQEEAEPETGKIDPHAIASRLSYFLWSSMPDRELFTLARTGELSHPDILRTQAERLLRDSKSDRFVAVSYTHLRAHET